jgi:aminopeptidase YwaD
MPQHIFSKDNVLYGEKEVDNTVLTIKIFPNPSHDEINIELQGCFNRYIDFSLYNSFGKNIYSNKANNATLINIDVSSLPKGVYILLCQIEHNIITEKIVIE